MRNRKNKHARFPLLKQTGERGFLSRLLPSLSGLDASRFLIPPGDDAAILKTPKKAVLSIDGLTDGVHFRSSWTSSCQKKYGFPLGKALGWKLLGSALSDLAAMGDVNKRWAMIFLGAPPDTPLSLLSEIQKGLMETARKYQCALAGGDTVKSRTLTLVAAVGGELTGARALRRTGVRPGDCLCLSGPIGEADMGLKILLGRTSVPSRADRAFFVRRTFQAVPQFQAGKILARTKGVTAAIDLSDSLQESIQLLLGNKLGMDMDIQSIPVSPRLARFNRKTRSLLSAAEDYSLLFSANTAAIRNLKGKIPFSILGQVRKSHTGLRIFEKGQVKHLPAAFKHFS